MKRYLEVFCITMMLSAIGFGQQSRQTGRNDPQAQLISNYQKFPERYIRIHDESWRYDEKIHSAFHSFALRNSAGIAYSDVEIRFDYLDAKGKTMQSQSLKIPGFLKAYEVKKLKDLQVKKVPKDSEQVTITVIKAILRP
jgi:hypothetical protein